MWWWGGKDVEGNESRSQRGGIRREKKSKNVDLDFFFSSHFRSSSAVGAGGGLLLRKKAAPARLPERRALLQARQRRPLGDPDPDPDRDQQQHRRAAQDPLPRAQDEDERDGRELEELQGDAELDELSGIVVTGGVD